MNIGFNTEIRVGARACHVQTEVHGPAHPVIDTVVYLQGRVLHRRSQSYEDLSAAPEFTEESLRHRVENQHRVVIEQLRAGTIEVGKQEPRKAKDQATTSQPRPVLQVQLLNPASWISAGTATLQMEVLSLPRRRPLPGARIEVTIGGTQGPICFVGKSDERGRAELSFPMPAFGPGSAELVIRVEAEGGHDEIRYALRPKPRTAPA